MPEIWSFTLQKINQSKQLHKQLAKKYDRSADMKKKPKGNLINMNKIK